jgi:hypothetical protein
MKINKKALELIENGLSSKTVSKLNESQIDVLHKKLVEEQINVSKTDTATITKLKNEKKPFQVYEKELDEEEEVTVDPNKETETQDANQVGPSSDDGFGGEDDGMGMFESEADLKPGQPNPWAICHAQVGPKKTRKFERCVQSVKKQLEEGKNPLSLFLENEISKLVEKHIQPKMTKGELLKYLSEGDRKKDDEKPPKEKTKPKPQDDPWTETEVEEPWREIDIIPITPKIEPRKRHPFKNPFPTLENDTKTAPVRTKPDVKPRTRPGHPMKNPHPGEKVSPKAKVDENNPAESPTIAPTRTKPDVKPRTRPSHPMKNPNPGEKTSPKAKKISPEVAKDKVIDTIMNILKK